MVKYIRPFSYFAAGVIVAAAFSVWMFSQVPAVGSRSDVKAFSSTQEAGKIIRDYLLRNPEVLTEATQALEAKRAAEQAAQAKAVIGQRRKELLNDLDSPVGGDPRGDVTVVQFFDYRCGFSRRVVPVVENVLKKEAGIRVVYKEFPILGPESIFAAKAALASRVQGKYAAFHKALMEGGGSFSEADVLQAAASVGIDTERLKKDMAAPEVEAIISRNHALAQALSIQGTPAFVVGDELYPAALSEEVLAQMVQRARGKQEPGSSQPLRPLTESAGPTACPRSDGSGASAEQGSCPR